MAVFNCQHCERENEIPDDELCPGYTDLIEALRWVTKMASHSPTDSQVISMAIKALAKVETHTCFYCGHTGHDVTKYAQYHVGGTGELSKRCCDNGELCAQRVEASK